MPSSGGAPIELVEVGLHVFLGLAYLLQRGRDGRELTLHQRRDHLVKLALYALHLVLQLAEDRLILGVDVVFKFSLRPFKCLDPRPDVVDGGHVEAVVVHAHASLLVKAPLKVLRALGLDVCLASNGFDGVV